MLEQPAGFVDLLADCDDAPVDCGALRDLEVPGFGTVLARRPAPKALGVLAMSANDTLELDGQVVARMNAEERTIAIGKQRQEYVTRFVRGQLADGEFDRMTFEMLDPDRDLPADLVWRTARCLGTWGTSRPFGAVRALAFSTGQHWRLVRTLCLTYGIEDPMRLPSMHAVLDVMEKVALESFAGSGEPKQDEARRDRFLAELYQPDPSMDALPVEPRRRGGKRDKGAPPSWWSDSGTSLAAIAGAR